MKTREMSKTICQVEFLSTIIIDAFLEGSLSERQQQKIKVLKITTVKKKTQFILKHKALCSQFFEFMPFFVRELTLGKHGGKNKMKMEFKNYLKTIKSK
jgi:hypothetical protein